MRQAFSKIFLMKTMIPIAFVSFIVLLTFYPTTVAAQAPKSDQFVVVLDAGHGGNDPGNMGNGFKEKDIALNIILKIGKELEKNPMIRVIYTRHTDVFVTLRGRAKIANDADADLFVSVHCNAHHSAANGTETFVLGLHANQRNFEVAKKENEVIYLEEDYETHYEGFDPNSPQSLIGLTLMQEEYLDQSIQLASFIENNFTHQLQRKTRGVKQAGFWVLHNTYMPSVLIETGFLTYKQEGAYLNSTKGQNQMSDAIVNAILKYKSKLDLNVGEHIRMTDTDNNSQSNQHYKDIVFKVQIAAGSRKLEPKPYNFKGLQSISREKSGSVYKYFYGETGDYNQIKTMQNTAKTKGFDSCFIVAYKNGERIALDEALKTPLK